MARYTLTFESNEYSAEFYRHYYYYNDYTSSTKIESDNKQDAKFTFDIIGLEGAQIKKISITAPVNKTEKQGGFGDFILSINSVQLYQWTNSDTTVWGKDDLSIAANSKMTLTLNLNHSSHDHATIVPSRPDEIEVVGYTGRLLGRATATIEVEADFNLATIYPLSGEAIPKSTTNTFSWSQIVPQGSVVSQTLYWKNVEDGAYNSITLGAYDTSYIFPAYTFTNGVINWYVQAVDDSGNVSTSNVETVGVGIVPSVVINYPNNINIRSSNKQIFTWEMIEAVATGQKSYTIKYKGDKESNWTTVSANSGNQYHEFAPNTFSTDNYTWQLIVVNRDDLQSEMVVGHFVSVGATAAPNITNISNSSVPTITWEVPSQDTFELEIFSGTERLYSSGVQVGHDVRSFTPNIMLEDGSYIVKMRAMNVYGYFTEWSDYSFILSPAKPDPVECIAYANRYHGINLQVGATIIEIPDDSEVDKGPGPAPTATYVLRRLFGNKKWSILGKVDSKGMFTDNTILSNVKYEYALRNYVEYAGYADSRTISTIIEFNGYIIYDGNNFVQLYKTEDNQFNITHTPSKLYSDSYTIGRKYPIRESSEWLAHTISLSCFVEFEEYKKLEDFYSGNNPLWFKGDKFSFKCSIDSIQIKETLLGKGYTLDISLSRMDEEEVNLLE